MEERHSEPGVEQDGEGIAGIWCQGARCSPPLQVGRRQRPPWGRGQAGCPSPFTGGVGAVEWVFEVDDGTVAVLQDALLMSVVLHQLGQRGELLPSIQVVEVPRVLDPNMGHLIPHPAGRQAVRPVGAGTEEGEVGTGWGS